MEPFEDRENAAEERYELIGPCYDYCDCRHCWQGWVDLSFRRRLWHRVQRIVKDLG